MISKKLLSEVLEYEVEWFDIEDNKLSFRFTFSEEGFINIYELAHKCKEWAFTKGYYLSSYVDSSVGAGCEVSNIACLSFDEPILYEPTEDYLSEPEAIFKACEWILKQKDEKEELRTSEEWIKEYPNRTIMDPDGWDRQNFQYSFREEKITKQEFERRLALSTCMFNRT